MRTERSLILGTLVIACAAVTGLLLLKTPTDSAPEQPAWVLVDGVNEEDPPSLPPYYIDEDGNKVDREGNIIEEAEPPEGEESDSDNSDTESEEDGTPAGDDRKEGSESDAWLEMSTPKQVGLSFGLIGLAFLALLPGRKPPENLRHSAS
ncbi:hypothetical protein [Haloglycomyces albus]|uniref:hypothetical protein n=1 Tax=Haloglycomyces albus TaxID=526067 RepID=UPI00046CC058|nr:hypothetical protein [Haloglycomyces albus]